MINAHGHILGFDVGGTKISAVIGNDRGEIRAKIERLTVKHLGRDRLTQQLYEMGQEAMDTVGLRHVDGIGIVFAGIVDNDRGMVVNAPNIPGMRKYEIVPLIQGRFDAPTVLENDATGAAIAERMYGSGRNVNDFAYITLSTGIGGGFFSGGRLVRGAHGIAGEFGHNVIMVNGPTCGCGRQGCLESLASGKAIARRVKENISAFRDSGELSRIPIQKVDAKAVFDAMEKGDGLSRLMVEETAYYLAVGIVNIVCTLDPEVIILGGGITKSGNYLFPQLRKAIRDEFKSMKRPVRIVKALPNVTDLAAVSLPLFYKDRPGRKSTGGK